MIKFIFTLCFSFLFFTPSWADVTDLNKYNLNETTYYHDYPFESFEFKNGFKLIFISQPSDTNTRIELAVRTGSALEGYGESGMAHLLEHMLFKSAGNIKDIKKYLNEIGAKWNGTTSVDKTNYFEVFSTSDQNLKKVIDLEFLRLSNATFTKKDLESEMTVVRNEMERGANSFQNQIYHTLMSATFPNHGYAHSTIGSKSDIENQPFDALLTFYKKHYQPNNSYMIISGNFNRQLAFKLVKEKFTQLKNSTQNRYDWTLPDGQITTSLTHVYMPSAQDVVASAWRTPAEFNSENIAIEVGIEAICNQEWGSLKKEIVDNLKISETVFCGIHSMNRAGLFFAQGAISKEKKQNTFLFQVFIELPGKIQSNLLPI